MSTFSSPASKRTDRKLYQNTPAGLARLAKLSRKELRQKGREEYWQLKQQAAIETASSAETPSRTTGAESI